MTRIYAEAPFVLQLALRQEHWAACEQLLELASAGAIVLALPLVALIEPLNTMRLRAIKRNDLNNSWRDEARQLSRTDDGAYQDAAKALLEALLKTTQMANNERRNLDMVITRIGGCAKILSPAIADFAHAYAVEARGSTPLDALALACIVEDARTLDRSTGRALLALDRKAVSAAMAADLAAADVKVFGTPDKLAPWLGSMGIALSLPS